MESEQQTKVALPSGSRNRRHFQQKSKKRKKNAKKKRRGDGVKETGGMVKNQLEFAGVNKGKI